MKKFIFLFFPVFFIAQTHRFVYEYQYKTDSTSLDYEKTSMILDVNPSEVKFYDYAYAENDSINKVRNYHNYLWNDTPAIKRNRNSFTNLNYILLSDFFSFQTTDKMDWILHSDTKREGKYTLQKATTNFGGRNWIAWFCKEINLDEGPYKFRGLPGLIFKIEDEKQNFIFNLVKSQNLKKTYDTTDFLETYQQKKALLVKEKVIQKKLLEFYNDPFQDIREDFVYDPNIKIQIMGQRLTSKDQLNDLTKSYQKYIRTSYNPIELDKAVHYSEK